MKEFYAAKKKITRNAIDLMIWCCIISIIINRWDFVAGFILGTLLSVLNFKMLAANIVKICNLQIKKEKIKSYVFTRHIIRYVLTFLVLLALLRNQNINIYTCLAGLFFIKLSVLWNYSLKYFLGGSRWVSL